MRRPSPRRDEARSPRVFDPHRGCCVFGGDGSRDGTAGSIQIERRLSLTCEGRGCVWQCLLKGAPNIDVPGAQGSSMQEQCSTYDLCRPSARQFCPATGVDGGLNPPLSGAGCRPGRFCQRCPCRTIQLVDARNGSARPATDVVDAALLSVAEAIGPTLEGNTERQKNPHPPHSLAWLAWIIARLGGRNCYYKPPGPKTMRAGWGQFETMAAGFAVALTFKLKSNPRIP
jgi:hypothetical protein